MCIADQTSHYLRFLPHLLNVFFDPGEFSLVSLLTSLQSIVTYDGHTQPLNVYGLLFRIYGPVLYPYLVTNWKFIWSTQGRKLKFLYY